MIKITNFEQLRSYVLGHTVIAFEGARCVGKTYLAELLAKLTGAQYYTSWVNRKQHWDFYQKEMGLDIAQMTPAVMDLISQVKPGFFNLNKLVLDRSSISASVWEMRNAEAGNFDVVTTNGPARMAFQISTLRKVNGCVILVDADNGDAEERAQYMQFASLYEEMGGDVYTYFNNMVSLT
jgi:hypothetical protein